VSMSYTSLVADKSVAGSIRSWQNYGKVDAEGVLLDAQAMLMQRLRVREMRSTVTFVVDAGDSDAPLPDRFLDPIELRNITHDCEIENVEEETLSQRQSWVNGELRSGDPAWYSILDEKFNFDCKAAQSFTARLIFYRRPEWLSASNPTNFLTNRYPHVLRAACLAYAAKHFKDMESYTRELREVLALVDDVNAESDLSRRGQFMLVEGP
jgi:hypothetical protein